MCDTCGCSQDEFTIHHPHEHHHEHSHGEVNHSHHHDHEHDHHHPHDDNHDHNHTHDQEHIHFHDGVAHSHEQPHEHSHKKLIDLNVDILSNNNLQAQRNRGFFEGRDVLCLNLVSSPGSGKTTILEKTIQLLLSTRPIFVIEGDQQTSNDAERIEKSGAAAIQINTGTGCHLDANMIQAALKKLEVVQGSVLFIENVGNLVCPAMFDLGEQKRVVVISVTEGDDKPIKYPYMFQSSDLCIINKIDLLPYVDFDMEKAIGYARQLKPGIEIIKLSAKTGEGMQTWVEWIVR